MLGRAVVAEARHRGFAALGLSSGQADVTDRDRLLYWVDAFRPQTLVNCAAFTRVDDCEEREEHAFAVNGRAVDHVVTAAETAEARLLHVSTDYVFGGDVGGDPGSNPEPYREDAPTDPHSVYGRSKLDGETRALAYERATVVRTSWLFGPGGPNFVTTILRLIAEGKNPLRVVSDQTGCPTYTPFLARALWDLAALELSEVAGVVHYRNREPVTWHGFAREIARLRDRSVEVLPVTTEEFPRPAPRPTYSVLDVSRFEEAVGREVEPWGWGLVEYLAALGTCDGRSARAR